MKRGLEIFSITAVAVLITFLLGYAIISGNAVSTSVQVKVTVLPLYKLFMQTSIQNWIVTPNSAMHVKITLFKTSTTKTSEKINVELHYEIYQGRNLIQTGALKNITLDKKQVTKTDTIKIPKDFSNFYTLKIIATSPQAYATETKNYFYVRKQFWGF